MNYTEAKELPGQAYIIILAIATHSFFCIKLFYYLFISFTIFCLLCRSLNKIPGKVYLGPVFRWLFFFFPLRFPKLKTLMFLIALHMFFICFLKCQQLIMNECYFFPGEYKQFSLDELNDNPYSDWLDFSLGLVYKFY